MKGKILDIKLNPDPVLRKISSAIKGLEIKDKKFKQFLADMEATMLAKDGAGLAAPQVGINKRVVVLSENGQTIFMINPEITRKSYGKITDDEGCLSVVNDQGEIYYQPVARHKWVNCRFLDQKGKLKKIKASNNLARAIQHEIDHLNGILFIDY